ncbi:MAG TPA: sigma factor-like helix-turn-helix DNA-binding protein, partial [Candidatus Elarobacter sp.]
LQREPALALHALGGLTARAVGERLGIPLRTAASRIMRGRRRLEAQLAATTPFSSRSNGS